MKRRHFFTAALAAVGSSQLGQFSGRASAQSAPASSAPASSSGLMIQALGHSCFLFSGSGQRVLVNPFRKIGCTAGYAAPLVKADLVMLSSRLFDEGYTEGLPGNPRILFEPGVYQLDNQQIQGIRTDHDRTKGRRFGRNIVWRWNQGGLTIVHLGGAAAPISIEQKILMGTPDVLLIPVSGGPKAYTPEEAKQAIAVLSPKLIIPTQYRTAAADAKTCDSQPVDAFLNLMTGTPVKRGGSSLSLSPAALPSSGAVIQVLTV
ncbi:MAG: MBL fold metallo-hydrolase [Synechococcales cyanobacterium RU_4_20]|nr:MBL fold metallo-hydrolase [Synechococcales cyanobacterium RU_4_20]NJR71095.1 MBL fold metallo-hydrolase [Synechococcales cyanobacterium CRU_2_2]